VFAAGLAGLAGALQTFGLGTAQPGTGGGDFLFQAVGAAIIGGVALTGGAGSIYGTFIGAAILGILNNGLVLTGIDPGLGVTVTGALIILAGVLQAGMRELIASLFTRAKVRQHRSSARRA
jgi:ribose/xylose/arabinose/galactoside ABC-type transport system permease subunit